MAQKNLRISTLLDCYGELLTNKQKYLLECYYNEDLSLSEIADNEGITPQGARDVIKRAADRLEKYEQKLGFAEYIEQTEDCAEKILGLCEKIADAKAMEIGNIAKQIIR